jgi:hypothetical protein
MTNKTGTETRTNGERPNKASALYYRMRDEPGFTSPRE